jgi:hypothetical protein
MKKRHNTSTKRKIAIHYTDTRNAQRGPTEHLLQLPVETQSRSDEGIYTINSLLLTFSRP